MPRRRAGTLIPLEIEIIRNGARLARDGERFHGFGLAQDLRASHGGRLVAHGTLYKALARLVDAGLLTAEWEEPEVAERAGRPRRRLYELTAAGQAALAALPRTAQTSRPRTAEAGA